MAESAGASFKITQTIPNEPPADVSEGKSRTYTLPSVIKRPPVRPGAGEIES